MTGGTSADGQPAGLAGSIGASHITCFPMRGGDPKMKGVIGISLGTSFPMRSGDPKISGRTIMKIVKRRLISCIIASMLLFSGCGKVGAGSNAGGESNANATAGSDSNAGAEVPELSYATMFSVSDYEGCRLVDIRDEGQFLVVPEGKEVPESVPEGAVVLKQPLRHVYVASTPAMDLIDAAGGLGQVAFSCLKAEDWYVEDAKEAMESGAITYAGKYSKPDYEMLLSGGCDLAIENTMIYHSPQVKEKLEELGIPVLVERSSYEDDPLGRLEWMKLYGILFGEEEAADAFFQEEEARVQPLLLAQSTGRSVAFFSVTSGGAVTVHKPGGYIAKMIEYGGGVYALNGLAISSGDQNALSTMHVQMEDFYREAKDCDVLIYNSAIEGQIGSISDLIARNSVLADFAAVKSGQVYCTDADFFQCVTSSCDFILDVNRILTGDSPDNLLTMEKLS